MEFDAVILAGGKATRLGGAPKNELRYDGDTLLTHALRAAEGAGEVVVVGPGSMEVPEGILRAREEPVFAGPAAAIAAGLDRLGANGASAPWTLVLACDMPHAVRGVAPLVQRLQSEPGMDGAMAVAADGRKQPLLGMYSKAALQREVEAARDSGRLTNSSVFGLLARLNLLTVAVPAGSTDDVDTWADAAALGIEDLGH
ncbi:NTP transferase domain-containing protein [Arthrobacter sp. fls2-241-R2A-200]|uniref:molybdenum cofactor guanylyltransferase n=2 Tax=Bacteria TaxID=2 RepID=UPI002550FA46|nr:NTP transferase domain-containing protein [Arthrobacter sp. fls2-241-R2A-200]